MNLGNCSRCGRIFAIALSGTEVCPACLKESEENYRKIFDYFAARPTATAQEICDSTGIDIKEIYRFVRENRLRLVKVDTGLKCEKCGGPIFGGKFSGKLCDNCRSQLATDLRKDMQKHRIFGSGSQNPSKTGLSAFKHKPDSKNLKKH